MSKIYDGIHKRVFRGNKHKVVKGIRGGERKKGDAVKFGSSARQIEIESNRRQIPILRKYIKELKKAKDGKEAHLKFLELKSEWGIS